MSIYEEVIEAEKDDMDKEEEKDLIVDQYIHV